VPALEIPAHTARLLIEHAGSDYADHEQERHKDPAAGMSTSLHDRLSNNPLKDWPKNIKVDSAASQ